MLGLPVRAGYHDLKDFVQSLERPRRVSCACAVLNACDLWAAPTSDRSLNAQFQRLSVMLDSVWQARTKFCTSQKHRSPDLLPPSTLESR